MTSSPARGQLFEGSVGWSEGVESNHGAARNNSSVCKAIPFSAVKRPGLQPDDVVMTSQSLSGTSNLRFGITTLSRSQSQVVQFLNGGSLSDCPSTPSFEISPLLNLYSTKVNSPRHIKTPVMHPNLVYTLKSILSPKLSLEFDNVTTSEDSRCTPSGNSQLSELAEVQGSEQGNSLRTDYAGKASPESSTSWPRCNSRSLKQAADKKLLQQEAIVVPVDLIQNRRPYQCAFTGCQRTFKNPQTMRMHHKTHFSDAAAARLGAEALQAGMPQGSPLKAGHNKKILSRCPTCNKTFVGLYELRRHYGRKHSEGEKSHACRKCGKRFHIEVDVRDHEKLCGEPIVCICGMKFAFKCNLVAHKRSHPKCQDKSAVEENRPTQKPSSDEQKGERKFSEVMLMQDPSLDATVAADLVPARPQLLPVQPLVLLDSASSSSPFSSNTSSSPFLAETMPDFDKNSSNLDYQCSSLSSGLLQADSYIKFPFDHYFLAALSKPVYQVPQRPSN